MADAWYYADGGESRGPFSEAQLRDMVSNRSIGAETLIWSEEIGEWKPFSATRLASQATAGSPPVIATPSGPRTGGFDPNYGKPSVGFGDAVRRYFRNYVNFSGRATRPEYWWPFLFVFLLLVVTMIIDGAVTGSSGMQPVTWIAQLAIFLPSLAVAIRRLHDTDRSGWWILISLIPLIGTIVLLVFLLQKGTEGQNRFG